MVPRTIEIVNQHDALARHYRAIGAVLEAYSELADLLRRFDEGPPDIVVADDTELVGNSRFLGIADCRRHAGIGNRYDHVGGSGRFAGKLGAAGLAHVVDAATADDRVGPREINVFEDAGSRRHRLERLERMRALFVEDQNLAVLHVAHVLRADDVESAGLRREDGATVELAEHQRPDAQRIARADELLIGEADEGIGAFEHAQSLDKTVDEAVAMRARHEMKDDLGVGRRLHHCAFAHELAAKRQAVGEIAVMPHGKSAGVQLGEQRLHIAQNGPAGGRVTHMADRSVAGQAIDHLAPREGVADQTEATFGMEAITVERDDAGGLLAAVLERMQAERRNCRGVGMAENAEYSAFLAEPVRVKIGKIGFGHDWPLSTSSLC